ncbi:hypothetical protein [Streptomyces althioticus]|uniref:hypothetical protein n=1 Tax=Streptomyces althioticus TaxID=83380 RepID=UPI0037D193CF
MPVKETCRSLTAVAALTFTLSAIALTEAAYAAKPVGSDKGASEQSGGSNSDGFYAAARITYSGSVALNGTSGNVTSADVNWTPPPCWYAPYLGAKDFKNKMSADIERQLGTPGIGSTAGSALTELKRHYEAGYGWADNPGYEDYNLDKDGEGMFWAGVENPSQPLTAARSRLRPRAGRSPSFEGARCACQHRASTR